RTVPRHVGRHVDAFCDFLRERRKVHCAIPRQMQGHAYRLYELSVPKLLDDGVLLIGDAAGLAYPQSGEGIRPAVESGLLAAEVILSAQKDFGRDRLGPYRASLEARFGRKRKRSLLGLVPFGLKRLLAGRLL